MLYTVSKPLNTDADFQAYVDLLEEKNVDVSRLERVREKGSDKNWLYAWSTRELAEQFARELRTKTRDDNWKVVGFEPESVTGLEIEVLKDNDGTTFRLSRDSLARINSECPNARPSPTIFIGNDTRADYERQIGSIEDQVIILLTSLSTEQLEELGGVSFRHIGSETLDPSTYDSAPPEYKQRAEATALEIDQLASDDSRFSELLERLITITLPEDNWSADIEVNPFRGGLEPQYWHWNRAGSRLLQEKRFYEAGEVFAAHYFSVLTLQLFFGHRYHKGMPLCNLGVALASAGKTTEARQSWLLGLIEDAVTSRPTASRLNNYKNLLPQMKTAFSLDMIVENVDKLVRGFGVTPILPESIVIQCLDPLQQAGSQAAIKAVHELSQEAQHSLPSLLSGPYQKKAADFWERIGFGARLEVKT